LVSGVEFERATLLSSCVALLCHQSRFSISVDSTCIKLLNLEDKKMDWSWKVNLTNSLGDLEGSRHNCTKKDDGWIGNPAIWKMSEMKFIAFNTSTNNSGFSASTFSCQVNPAK